MSEQHTFNRQNRVFPQKSEDKPLNFVEEQRIPERRWLGHILSILGVILGIVVMLSSASTSGIHSVISGVKSSDELYMILGALAVITGFSLSFFHIAALIYPEYLGGQPSLLKILPLLIGISFPLTIAFWVIMDPLGLKFKNQTSTTFLFVTAMVYLIISALVYYVYSRDDDSGSCWLCFKPWNLKRLPQMNSPVYGQPQLYPSVYPQQGYPPQRAAYSPQGYPLQQQQQFWQPPKV